MYVNKVHGLGRNLRGKGKEKKRSSSKLSLSTNLTKEGKSAYRCLDQCT